MLLALSLFGVSPLIHKPRVRANTLANTITGLGTLWCGMARSMNSLIAGRVVAGMGGGG